MNSVSIYPSGENALSVSFGDSIDLKTNTKVFMLYHTLVNNRFPYCVDIIPSYTTLTVIYDLIQIKKHHKSAFESVKTEVQHAIESCDWNRELNTRSVSIPVCYDSSFAPDSERLASFKKITTNQLIELHHQQNYHVFMIGFLPGFAYMGTVDKRIATPRLAKPRTQVAEGSVGIAGEQTGIYPMESPGGWNIIGRTPLKLFDRTQVEQPVLLQPGDRVQFIPITKDQFHSFDQVTFEFSTS